MKKQLLAIGLMGFISCGTILQAQSYVNKKILNNDGSISLITFKPNSSLQSKTADNLFKEILNVSPKTKMKLEATNKDASGKFYDEKYQMYYDGIKVEFGIYNLHYKNGDLISMNGNSFNTSDAVTAPIISAQKAFNHAIQSVKAKAYMWDNAEYIKNNAYKKPSGELVLLPIVQGDDSHKLILAYKFDIYASQPLSRGYVFVDASDGTILMYNAILKHTKTDFPSNNIQKVQAITITQPKSITLDLGTADTRYSGNKQITTSLIGNDYVLNDATRGSGVFTYNSAKTQTLPTTNFKDADNNWTAAEFDNANFDNAALDAHWGVSKTYDYFKETFNRNSYDNNGAALKSYIHYSNAYENAGWTGSEMVYGDGASTFKPLTAFDVTAHELGHAVCQETADLKYERESGALNEGFSDIWGAVVEHKYAPEKQPWLIGEDITKAAPGYLRSMSNPKSGLGAQPDTYHGNNWKAATIEEGCVTPLGGPFGNDYCGVHTNSGVLNHWFYILVEGKTGTNDLGKSYNVTGIGWDKAEQIVYKLETTYMTPTSTYRNARDYAIQVAQEIYGTNTPEAIATQDAFYAVGVGPKYLSTPDTTPPTVPTSLTASNVRGTTATLTWGASTDNIELEGYILYKDGTEFKRLPATTYNATGLTNLTTYTFTVKAVDVYNNISEASNNATFTTTDEIPYCTSQGNSTSDEKIQKVQFGTISNTSTNTAGYEDYSNISTEVTIGQTYPITITPIWTSTIYNEGYAVYIDWNADGDFSDAGETAFTSPSSKITPIVGNITIPANASLTKDIRMRVSMKFGAIPTACEIFSYGQVEDYTLKAKQDLAVNDINNKTVNIYPNPVKDIINIQSKKIAGDTKYQIINNAGQILQTGITNNQKVNVQSLPIGNYVLQLLQDGETTTHKFIKK